MSSLQSVASVSFVLAMALLGAGCAVSDQAVKDGDDLTPRGGDPAHERIGEAELLQRWWPGGGGGEGGGGGGGGWSDCVGIQDGAYCGGDAVSGDPSTLYQCWRGQKFTLRYCSYGCEWMPPGVADRCR